MRVSTGTPPVTNEQAQGLKLKSAFFAAIAGTLLFAGAAHAESYKFGDIDLSIDTTVSAGVSMRTGARSCEHVSLVNGGCTSSSGRSTSVNSDNGNLNFDRGDLTNALARVTADVQLKWQNYGAFVRPTAYYNAVYAKNDMRFRDLNHDGRGQLEYQASVLDAFVYGNWDVDGHATTLRVGKQALNWGESIFITGGVNAFQAFDVTALRTPGAELKDGMTPMPMVYGSFAVTDALTLEAFWQFSYARTELDPAGSFFSTDDITGRGSLPALSAPDIDNPDYAITPGDLAALIAGTPVPIALQRTADTGHSDTNQFGVAAHYYAEEVGTGTDFGLYFVRYSSRLPYLAFTNGPSTMAQSCAAIAAKTLNTVTCASAQGVSAAFAYGANQATYYYDFPTINTIGASFSTTVEGVALSGETTFSPDMPFGIYDGENNAAQIDGLGAAPYLSGGACVPQLGCTFSTLPYAPGPNQSTLAHIDLDAWQGQVAAIQSFATTDFIPRNLGADSGVLVLNGGFVYVADAGKYPLNRSGPEGGLSNPFAAHLLAGDAGNPQYATSFSSGYRALLSVDYPSAFDTAVTLSPKIVWRHDVLGYSPGPNTANYLKGLKEVTLAVDAKYQSVKATLSWTSSFGAGWYNPLSDRDYATASISYAF
ncbi:DUF1302 domain-containing protein [Parvibaculum sp.]|uniref:DUF1302 domain-containing protein n=1 Tax=Parvibaculum sp. TaxID=2024848 RepID=UPI00320C101A